MATSEQALALTQAFINVFGTDVDLIEASLTRIKLQTEYAQIQSSIRVAQAEQSADIDAYNAQIQSLQTQLNNKQAELDLL